MNGVSIITISNNRKELLKTIKSVFSRKREIENVVGGKWEYIVVEVSNSKISDFPIKHLLVEKGGFSYQRNIGVRNSKFDVIVFIDDGMELGEGWFEKMVKPIFSGECDAVLGAVFPSLTEGKNFSDVYKNALAVSQSILGFPGGGLKYYARGRTEIQSFSTSNLAIRKKLILDVGGFDEELIFGAEDSDLSIRIKEKFPDSTFIYEPSALVFANPRKSIREISRWFVRRGKSFAYILKKHKGVKLSHLIAREIILLKLVLFSSLFPSLTFYLSFYSLETYKILFSVTRRMRSEIENEKRKFSGSSDSSEYKLKKKMDIFNFLSSPHTFVVLFVLLPFVRFVMDLSFSYGFYSVYSNFLFGKLGESRSRNSAL